MNTTCYSVHSTVNTYKINLYIQYRTISASSSGAEKRILDSLYLWTVNSGQLTASVKPIRINCLAEWIIEK